MTLTTSMGQTIEVDWAWAPVGLFGDMMFQFHDERPLGKIASDFDGIDHIRRESQEEGDMDFDGYTVLRSIQRPFYETDPSAVQITLTKPQKG